MSKKNVTLRIVNRQYQPRLEPKGEAFERVFDLEDEFEVMTEGTLYTKRDATFITYDELADAGLETNRTLLKATKEALEVRRYGEGRIGDMDLELEKGRMAITRYHAPMGTLEMEIYTNDYAYELDEEGFGRLFAEYNIKVGDFMNRRNRLEITVRPDEYRE